MAVILRDYQQDIIDRGRVAMKKHKRVLFQAPTGAGKTALASFMAAETSGKGGAVWFICHRAELVLQTSLTFQKFGIVHGFIAAGYLQNLRAPVQICSIDTLKNRLNVLQAPKLAIMDECHHASAAGWARVVKWLTDAGSFVVGLSATPERLDGKGLDEHFDEMITGPAVSWLMAEGHLSPYRMFCPDAPDMKGVRKQMGDFARGETAEKMDTPKLTGNVINHWLSRAKGMQTVAFGITVAHSQHIAAQFNMAGIPAAHLDGGTDKAERKRIIRGYADGTIQVLSNVGLFGEGFDLSAIAQTDTTIDCCIDLNPTQSLSWCLQKWGRVLRPSPGKTAVILDHSGNALRHGFPDDDRIWSLEGDNDNKKKDAAGGPPPPVICDKCFNAIRRPLPPACPHCGKQLIKEAKEIEVAEGELIEVDAETKSLMRHKRKQEEELCKTLDELVALGQRRGVKSPMAWASDIMRKRSNPKARYLFG